VTAGYRIGCDVGGTFTDLICVTPAGEIVLDKTPTTLDDAQLVRLFDLFCAGQSKPKDLASSLKLRRSTVKNLRRRLLRKWAQFHGGSLAGNNSSTNKNPSLELHVTDELS